MQRLKAMIIAIIIAVLLILSVRFCVRLYISTRQAEEVVEEPIAETMSYDFVEAPYEPQMTQAAIVDMVMNGEDYTLNMDADLVMRILTAEMSDTENFEGVWAVATMMYNSWTLEHSLMTNIKNGWYASPADHIGEKARLAFYEVFVFSNKCPMVDDAMYFYSTRGGFVSDGHEQRHELVCEIENYDGSMLRCFR